MGVVMVLPSVVVVPPPGTVVTRIGAWLGGMEMTIDGGVTLCCGVMMPVVGSSEPTMTGQKGMLGTTKGGTLMVVVTVVVAPAEDCQRAVVNGGQVTVIGVGRISGGRRSVQGGKHPTVGWGSGQMSWDMYTRPSPPEGAWPLQTAGRQYLWLQLQAHRP